MSIESIARPARGAVHEFCTSCQAPLAADQRYCLQCGERCAAMSSVLLGGPGSGKAAERPPAALTGATNGRSPDAHGQRSSSLTVIAGVGVLLLAMGVGVLVGRAASSGTGAAPAPVISVASTPSSGTSNAAAAEAAFHDDWPSGTSGYTVQLQTLPHSSPVSAVRAARSAAAAKGAKDVGALSSEDFPSLSPGHYVVYSGVYHGKAEALKALAALRKQFPQATVIQVSAKSSAPASARESGPSSEGGSGGVGQSIKHPAPPTVVKSLHNVKGKSYEEKSKNLPNVISTG